MNYLIYILVLVLSSVFISCSQDSKPKLKEQDLEQKKIISWDTDSSDKNYITKKIMYDVCIVNETLPDRSINNPDWFYNNIPTPFDSQFINRIFSKVKNGKLQAYYYDNYCDYESFTPIPLNKQADFLNSEMKISKNRYDKKGEYVETILTNAKAEHVKKIRFLEEWYIKDGVFKKNIIAIAPFFSSDDCNNTIYGGYAFFWIMANDFNDYLLNKEKPIPGSI